MHADAEASQVATDALDAANRGDFQAIAHLTNASDVEKWFASYTKFEEAEFEPMTVDRWKKYHPHVPDAVIEYQVEAMNRGNAERQGTIYGFAGITTRRQLLSLTSNDALARSIQARDARWQYHEEGERLNLSPEQREKFMAMKPHHRRDFIGMIMENAATAHAIYRLKFGVEPEADEGEMQVLTLTRNSEGWRLRMHGELFHGNGHFLSFALDEPPGEGDDKLDA